MIGLAVAPVHQVGAAQQYVNDADINVIDAATAATWLADSGRLENGPETQTPIDH